MSAVTNRPFNVFAVSTSCPSGNTPKEQIERFEIEESSRTDSLAEIDRASHRAIIKRAVEDLWKEHAHLQRQGQSASEICIGIRRLIEDHHRKIPREQESLWREIHSGRAPEESKRESLGQKIVRAGADLFKYAPVLPSREPMVPPPVNSETTLSSKTFHFSERKSLQQCLKKHSLLNTEYYREKGITTAVSELAADRFQSSETAGEGVSIGSMLVVDDLKRGQDGFTGKSLKRLDLPERMTPSLTLGLEKALTDCAN